MSTGSDRGPHWVLRKRAPSTPSTPNPTLVEVHEWVQPTHCHQHDNTLRHGHLLRWMDVAACLSAEKHAKVPCVTVSVDDITFDATVSVGHVVILRAVVNRAFTSSLEVGLLVKSEDPLTGNQQDVCNALFVFVARPKDGIKVKLPPVAIATEEENREHLLAAERRRMRVTYTKDLEKLLKNIRLADSVTVASPLTGSDRKVRVSDTQVHTVQIVLPVHANHHGTTFGGQIMEWMTDVATISALRLCRSQLVLEGIESVIFRGPSHMGERVSLQSSVNKVFSTKSCSIKELLHQFIFLKGRYYEVLSSARTDRMGRATSIQHMPSKVQDIDARTPTITPSVTNLVVVAGPDLLPHPVGATTLLVGRYQTSLVARQLLPNIAVKTLINRHV